MRKFTFYLFIVACYLAGFNFSFSQQWEATGTIVVGGNGFGNAPNQISQLMGVAVDAQGNVYVPDLGNSRVMKWSPGATEGVLVAGGLGWNGTAAGLALPTDIIIDEDNTLYISDTGNNRVQMWTEGATQGVTIAGGNGMGNEFNQLNWAGGIFKNGDDLYIMDSGNSRVLKWIIGEDEGVIVAGGSYGAGLNQFANPTMNGKIVMDGDNNIYISDYGNKRVTKWAPNATEGVIVANMSEYADPRTSGIVLLGANDKMLVTYAHGVALWESGQFQRWIVDPALSEVSNPTDICIDSNWNLYVADYGNNRVKKFDYICNLTASVESQSIIVCEGEDVVLRVNVSEEGSTVNWYDSEDAETPVFVGNEFDIFEIVGTHSFWVEAYNQPCKTERIEVVVTVNPTPALEAETTYAICSGSEASLYANSPSNVIFWYANENDIEYLYHGNLFVTEELTENTTYWVESYNLSTGCTSERVEVTVTVDEALSTPIADPVQHYHTGLTLADLVVEHTGTLTWYADAQLTQVLPETTLVVAGTIYYVTQSAGACESPAAPVMADTFLTNGNLNQDQFAYYPNPVKDVLNFSGKEVVKSVQVYDLSGKLILTQNSNSISNINLSNLPKGTYVVKAATDKGMNTFKIVKN